MVKPSAGQRVVIAQMGARMHYSVPRIMAENGKLLHFFTDLAWPFESAFGGHNPLLSRLQQRQPNVFPTTMHLPLAALYGTARRTFSDDSVLTGVDLAAGEIFARWVARNLPQSTTTVYGFNSASLELLREARRRGIETFVEQTNAPTAVRSQLMQQQWERFPAWGFPPLRNDFLAEKISREESEWGFADKVICGSEFVAEGLKKRGVDETRSLVVNYGISSRFNGRHRSKPCKPLRVVMVGEIGLRKGLPQLCQAARSLGGCANIRAVGPIRLTHEGYRELARSVDLIGAVPRSEVRRHLDWADVFVLPSICEGSATVTYEALASGLPVVCTPNTGSVVRNNRDGFIVPAFDSDALASAIESFLHGDLLYSMSKAALERRNFVSVDGYGQRLIKAIEGD